MPHQADPPCSRDNFRVLEDRLAKGQLWKEGQPRVLIIGAGTSGITCAAQFLAKGLRPVMLERRYMPGGIWSLAGHPAMYSPLTHNTSPRQMCMWDGKISPAASGLHFTGREYAKQVAEYFRVKHLREITYFGCEVTLIEARSKRPVVHVSDASPEKGATASVSLAVDHVIYAAGAFDEPVIPQLHGLSSFRGPTLHASELAGALELLRNRRTILIGLGNTSLDVARTVHSVCRSVAISGRRPTWIVPRTLCDRPIDEHVSELIRLHGDRYTEQLRLDCSDHGAVFSGPMPPMRIDFRETRILTNTEVLPYLRDGRISLLQELTKIECGKPVLKDGSVSEAEALVFCTGFRANPPKLIGLKYPNAPLVANLLHPECDWFWFVGVTPLWGGTVALARRASRISAEIVAAGRSGDALRSALKKCPPYERGDALLPFGFELVEANSFASHLDVLDTELRCNTRDPRMEQINDKRVETCS